MRPGRHARKTLLEPACPQRVLRSRNSVAGRPALRPAGQRGTIHGKGDITNTAPAATAARSGCQPTKSHQVPTCAHKLRGSF